MRIVVIGGGVAGLSAAMLLGKDGHDVTVLERDEAPPPDTAAEAWSDWTRRGVGQFRLLHYFLPRFRQIVEAELPEVAAAFDARGALRSNPMALAPDSFTGGFRAGDEQFEALTARRPVAEAAIATAAAGTPGVEVRRGVAVAGLVAEPKRGVPHVVGVELEDGERVLADLVVDAAGRRSRLPAMLAAVSARPPIEEVEDCGFVYFGRHFSSADGSVPAMLGGPLQHYGSVSTLTLPADNGTWGYGMITSAKDAALRPLKDRETWMRVARTLPLVAHWADGEPLDDVQVMAKIEDRYRRFVVDGAPVATGVVAIADSWACTNPSVGRGASIGLMHALVLRDLLRRGDAASPVDFALAFDEATETTVAPWFRSTLELDRHRLAEIDAEIGGTTYDPGDMSYEMGKGLEFAAGADPDVLRAFLSVASVLRTPEEVLAEPGLMEKVIDLGAGWRDAPRIGPDRQALLTTVAG